MVFIQSTVYSRKECDITENNLQSSNRHLFEEVDEDNNLIQRVNGFNG